MSIAHPGPRRRKGYHDIRLFPRNSSGTWDCIETIKLGNRLFSHLRSSLRRPKSYIRSVLPARFACGCLCVSSLRDEGSQGREKRASEWEDKTRNKAAKERGKSRQMERMHVKPITSSRCCRHTRQPSWRERDTPQHTHTPYPCRRARGPGTDTSRGARLPQ